MGDLIMLSDALMRRIGPNLPLLLGIPHIDGR
jgi:hypothetical protein